MNLISNPPAACGLKRSLGTRLAPSTQAEMPRACTPIRRNTLARLSCRTGPKPESLRTTDADGLSPFVGENCFHLAFATICGTRENHAILLGW
jgi:hypothetical protein